MMKRSSTPFKDTWIQGEALLRNEDEKDEIFEILSTCDFCKSSLGRL